MESNEYSQKTSCDFLISLTSGQKKRTIIGKKTSITMNPA